MPAGTRAITFEFGAFDADIVQHVLAEHRQSTPLVIDGAPLQNDGKNAVEKAIADITARAAIAKAQGHADSPAGIGDVAESGVISPPLLVGRSVDVEVPRIRLEHARFENRPPPRTWRRAVRLVFFPC